NREDLGVLAPVHVTPARSCSLSEPGYDEVAMEHATFGNRPGYVTVSAPDLDALEEACGEVEQLAQQCRLQLTRLRGQQPKPLPGVCR
ncbi:MAG: hypothetical protein LC792_28115, partial [Actinobacteria bacterium]|nr:hypothetical protein [Actinomycetota bacterium]